MQYDKKCFSSKSRKNNTEKDYFMNIASSERCSLFTELSLAQMTKNV